MATNPNPKKRDAAAPTLRARVLADIEALGLKVGQIFEAEEAVIKAMFSQGHVDAHPDAVAYAESTGAEVVSQPLVDASAETSAA